MIINNKKEFENFYPYSKDQIDEYPKKYPCVVKIENEGGGLMGDYLQVYVAYFPEKKTSYESFLCGLNNPWKILK